MKSLKYTLLGVTAFICLFLWSPAIFSADEMVNDTPTSISDRIQELINSGTVSEAQVEQVQEAVQEGKIDPSLIEVFRQKAETGTLTDEEIDWMIEKISQSFLDESESI